MQESRIWFGYLGARQMQRTIETRKGGGGSKLFFRITQAKKLNLRSRMCGFRKRCIGFDPKHSKKWLHVKDSRFLPPVFLQILRLQCFPIDLDWRKWTSASCHIAAVLFAGIRVWGIVNTWRAATYLNALGRSWFISSRIHTPDSSDSTSSPAWL